MCNVALPTIERSPLRRGSNPGPLDQWTKSTGANLQNKSPVRTDGLRRGEGSLHALYSEE